MYPREYFDTFWRGDLRNEVFVIMSFDREFESVWTDAIKPAIEMDTAGNPAAHRVDITTLSGSIITEILDGIAHAKLVFAEVSVGGPTNRWAGQRNGNAMYELGLAHALRQPQELVVVRSDHEVINFDINSIRIQSYDRDDLVDARGRFAGWLNNAITTIDQTKHLKVMQAYESLDSDTLRLAAPHANADYFYFDDATTMREVMSQLAHGEKASIRHLLSLGMLRFDFKVSDDKHAYKYAYHWTPFGKAVLIRLGLRDPRLI